MMQMEHRQTQRQTQQLVLTQKMQQALHILQLSSVELDQYVQQELENNPFLDQVMPKEELPAEKAESTTQDDNAAFEENCDLDAYADKWDLRHKEGQDLSRNTDLYERQKYYEDSITQSESLRAHLLTQMHLATETEADYAIGERIIIGDIDERGYFTGDVDDIAEELTVSEEDVWRILRLLQTFDPVGVGAQNTQECLLLQIQAEFPKNEALKTLVRDHLEDLMHRQIPKIAKAMRIKPAEVEELKKLLATLNPFPGHEYTSSPPQYITPEVVVEKNDDVYTVRLMSERSPQLEINRAYHKSVRPQATSTEEKQYLRQKMEAAQWLTRNITQRQQTILKVAQAIVDVQQEFFEKGIEHIRPLTLQDIADVIGVHESTVARTTRGKYMQTPQGLFELKYFFSPGLNSSNGDTQSAKSIQALVKKIIDEEDKRKPLSDQKIADMIKEQGTTIARRTVTKYREAMGILKTSLRKEY